MATVKFAFAQNQQLQQHCCVFIICFLTFLVCKICWFFFVHFNHTLLIHCCITHKHVEVKLTLEYLFAHVMFFFIKLGCLKKRLRKSSGKKYCLLFPAGGLFETTFFNFIQACNSAEREKQRGLFPQANVTKKLLLTRAGVRKVWRANALEQLFLSFRKELLEKLSCFQMHLLHFETPYFLG